MLLLFVVSIDILGMHLSKSILDAFFFFVDHLPHLFEKISHHISSITIALFKLVLISLIFL